jgi:MCM OB domain
MCLLLLLLSLLLHAKPLHAVQMVALRGMVIRSSAIIPDLKQAFFRCIVCGDVREVMIDRGRIEEPGICLGCGTRNAHEVIHNRCMFTDKQVSCTATILLSLPLLLLLLSLLLLLLLMPIPVVIVVLVGSLHESMHLTCMRGSSSAKIIGCLCSSTRGRCCRNMQCCTALAQGYSALPYSTTLHTIACSDPSRAVSQAVPLLEEQLLSNSVMLSVSTLVAAATRNATATGSATTATALLL